MLVVFRLPNGQTNINTYTWLLGKHDKWNVYTNTVYCVQTTGMGVTYRVIQYSGHVNYSKVV